MSDRRARLTAARLYLVCDRVEPSLLDAALHGGVEVVQLRMKTAGDAEVLAAAAEFQPVCAAHRALLILNDRPDLAVRCGADGVHLGQDDMPVADARAIVGPELLIGRSTHSPAQIDAARELDVDYIGVGPVHATPTKPGRAPVGVTLIGYAAERAPLPFFAIGGIDETNIAAVLAAGASRVAVVRAITEASDPARVARALRAALDREGGADAA
jgi:thiamine-phosphate pyrophosphorylase